MFRSRDNCLAHLTAQSASARSGLSLLEVLIAFVLLTGALAALGQRVSVGVTAATRLQDETDAALRCESVLNMILSGAETNRTRGPFADDPAWLWTSGTQQSNVAGMLELTVTVQHSDQQRKAARCSLVRLVRDDRDASTKTHSQFSRGNAK
ncbi:MAG: hypothetical protein JNM43_20495 [Planctomycetaceae bacterium]|nr:hypothetical protein [Planctomycetaceae bacterium]